MPRRRGVPVAVLALGVVVLLVSYILYSRRVADALRAESSRTGRMFARVYRALNDPSEENGTAALLDLSSHIVEMRVPVIVTDARGRPTAWANLPFEATADDPRVAAYVRVLDAENLPVTEPGVGTVHYGHTPLVRSLRVIPVVQAAMLGLLVIAAAYALRTRASAERERVWAGMARESAHQLGTPLSSLHGWLELLDDQADGEPYAANAVRHMRGDIERLERVAHRFERIGRPPRRDPVDVGALAVRVASYFRARAPTLAHAVRITAEVTAPPGGGSLGVRGDEVLLEWALESLVKNAVDALAGRGGNVRVIAEATPEGGARVRVADDGPGVPRELRARIFDAGFSTKQSGWGIGLPLARRIVEDNHGGRLLLAPTDRGAAFDIILPG